MIVCSCKVISDREVARAVDAGATSVDAVGQMCGAGTGCGGCHAVLEAILEERGCGGCPRARSANWSPYAAPERIA